MPVTDLIAGISPTFSVEFFPPHSDARLRAVERSIAQLECLPIDFVSVTYGAGGTTRERTHTLVASIQRETRFDPIAHFTCVCHTHTEVENLLVRYANAGINAIMALGGDPPRDAAHPCPAGDYPHAIDLVRHIVDFNRRGLHPNGRGFDIGVAGFPEGHPATPNRTIELRYLKEKVEAGADFICTQLFFDNHDFHDFRSRCEYVGIKKPIIAGLMPIISQRAYQRIPELALGTRYPASFMRQIERLTSDSEMAHFSVNWTLQQCRDLLQSGVAGVHFYCLNEIWVIRALFEGLDRNSQSGIERGLPLRPSS